MEKLNELAELARLCDSMKSSVDANAAYANFICRIEPKDITAIAEAFRELEQRAEAAESNSNYNGGDARYWHDEYCAQQQRLVSKIVALEERLAELAKQEPVGYAVKRFDNGNFGSWLQSKGMAKGNADYYVVPLFERPAPSAGWEGLIPKRLPMDIPFAAHRIRNGGWNDCINAILRNIEDAQ